jgi:predicted dehydrogenase/threonine dehydrogenase-like Zn-dependent dehydrogenase
MKQILQNLSNGQTILADVPCPSNKKGSLLIATQRSLVSSGTEKMLVDFGKANLVDKARKQPDKVKMVIDKVKNDGLLTTIDAVRSKLDQPLPLGYCNAGIVLESSVSNYSIGDRVISNGYHAEVVRVAEKLCAKIPDEVDDDSAAFTVIGAVGLQGLRLVNPTIGEIVVVSGLGLIGLMTVQMLIANGCHVLGIDYDSSRCKLAKQFGANVVDLSKGEDPIEMSKGLSKSRGVDAVIITASTESSELIHQAAQMCRKRARIVLVGVVGLNLRRDDFFKKEITFQVSASYGPGRYDPLYEEIGNDYPIGFVRWTEQRNFEAILDMMASGVLNVQPLISHRFSIEKALDAYEFLGDQASLGILLNYSENSKNALSQKVINLTKDHKSFESGMPVIGFIGAGNYASRILIPAIKKTRADLHTLVTSGGISGVHHGSKAGFLKTTTDIDLVWNNSEINTVVIATRHNQHASQVISAIESGKNIFVEKPLALKLTELDMIDKAFIKANKSRKNPLKLMIGFNRRFSPQIIKMKSLLDIKHEPKVIVITVNAGQIPSEHWTQDPVIGGGRIIGEGCHFIDLMRYLVGKKIVSHHATMIGSSPHIDIRSDKVSINLSFEDGSFGTIHYLSNGGKAFPKERVEVFCGDSALQMDNYRILKGFDWPNFSKMKSVRQDKGQISCSKAFVDSIKQGKASPISYDEIIECSRISIEVSESLS